MLKSAVLSTSIAIPGLLCTTIAAMAQSAATPAAPAADASKITASVVPYGILQSRMMLKDSTRQNTPDFGVTIMRFGLKASYGIAVAQLETGLTGNTFEKTTKETVKDANGNDVEAQNYTGAYRIGIRRADLGLKVKATDMVTASLSFGRVRPGNADAWGVSQTLSTDGFAYTDGARVGVNIDLQEGNTVSAGIVYSNALITRDTPTGAILMSSPVSPGSLKKEKAFIANVNAVVSNVRAAFYYGSEANQPMGMPGKSYLPEVSGAGLAAAPKLGTSVADVSHMELSLGYDMGNIGAGFWMQNAKKGKSKPITKVEGGAMTLGTEVNNAKVVTDYGVGVNGDSTVWGMQDLLQKDDKLTYGASWNLETTRDDAVTVKAAEKKNDATNWVFGVGYAAGGLSLELDYIHNHTDANSFAGHDGTASVAKNQDVVSVDATYAF